MLRYKTAFWNLLVDYIDSPVYKFESSPSQMLKVDIKG